MPSNEPQTLHPFFERSINSTLPQRSLLFNRTSNPAADFPRKLEGETWQESIRSDDNEPHRNPKCGPRNNALRLDCAYWTTGSPQPCDEQFKFPSSQPLFRNCPDTLGSFENPSVNDPGKRRKLKHHKSLPIDKLLAPAAKRDELTSKTVNCQSQGGDSGQTNYIAYFAQPGSSDEERMDSAVEHDIDESLKTPDKPPSPQIAVGLPSLSGPTSVAKKVPEAPSPPKASKPILQLNGSGNFELPHPTIMTAQEQDQKPPRKFLGPIKCRTRAQLVIIKYGHKDKVRRAAIGRQINDIQNVAGLPDRDSESFPVRLPESSKPTHPFFLGNAPKKYQPMNESEVASEDIPASFSVKQNRSVISFSTPGKLRYQAHKRFDDRLSEANGRSQPRLASTPHRVPGTVEPSWPARGSVHVGRLHHQLVPWQKDSAGTGTTRKRKSKVNQIQPPENLMRRLSARLFPVSNEVSIPRSPEPSQRHPSRLLLSGQDLQNRVLKNLNVVSEEELARDHGKLLDLFREIGSSMSLFDIGECGSIAWTQKYAPKSVREVLQSEREMIILRSWLESQAVVSTDIGVQKQDRAPEDRRKRRKQRPRRSDDLNGFIVEGDEELSTMRDLSDEESQVAGGLDNLPRSLVTDRFDEDNRGEPLRMANAVLLSGPHGCGKTAAAKAAAIELRFEVFEIGPGSRRSGKDILDKVGDMALNHQVSNADASLEIGRGSGDDTSPANPPKDQNTLTNFFTATSNLKKGPKRKRNSALPVLQRVKKQPSHQKQSLILLEEVDVLFDQDKQFWETVIDLAVQSKRPIIMTCSDESLVPWDELSLHAVLRLRPPQEVLATKYLLLLAAVEGHLLRYNAVASLYRSRNFDLRASITDLNFWCQMAVGDRKGGMEWHLERWPPGVDLDMHGQKLRVVSESTLVTGFGVGQAEPQGIDSFTAYEELIFEAWAENIFEPSHISSLALEALVTDADQEITHPLSAGRVASLRAYEEFSSLTSAVDVFSAVDLPLVPLINEIMDTTEPPMPESQRSNFTEGLPLLQADVLTDYTRFDAQAAIFMHLTVTQLVTQMSQSAIPPEINFIPSHNCRQGLLESLLSNRGDLRVESIASTSRTSIFAPFEPLRDDAQPSCFDHHSLSVVAEDVAPYVRSVAAYDISLEHQRDMLSSSHDRQPLEKSMRKTRASRSAFAGSQRDVTRRERWFCKDMDLEAALQTGGSEWPRLAWNEM